MQSLEPVDLFIYLLYANPFSLEPLPLQALPFQFLSFHL